MRVREGFLEAVKSKLDLRLSGNEPEGPKEYIYSSE